MNFEVRKKKKNEPVNVTTKLFLNHHMNLFQIAILFDQMISLLVLLPN